MSPTISDFYGIKVEMRFKDDDRHHKPHVHASYAGFEASIGLDGELLRGKMPRRQLDLIKGWIRLYEDELYAAWNAAVQNKPVPKIPPLKKEEF